MEELERVCRPLLFFSGIDWQSEFSPGRARFYQSPDTPCVFFIAHIWVILRVNVGTIDGAFISEFSCEIWGYNSLKLMVPSRKVPGRYTSQSYLIWSYPVVSYSFYIQSIGVYIRDHDVIVTQEATLYAKVAVIHFLRKCLRTEQFIWFIPMIVTSIFSHCVSIVHLDWTPILDHLFLAFFPVQSISGYSMTSHANPDGENWFGKFAGNTVIPVYFPVYVKGIKFRCQNKTGPLFYQHRNQGHLMVSAARTSPSS